MITSTAHIYTYDLKAKQCLLHDLSIYHLLTKQKSGKNAVAGRLEVQNIVSGSVREDGSVALLLADQSSYLYDPHNWKTWMRITTESSKDISTLQAADMVPLNSLGTLQSARQRLQAGLGRIDRLEALMEPVLADQSVIDTGALRVYRTLGLAEHQIRCCEMLNSDAEWVGWTVIYIKRLVQAVEDVHKARIAEADSRAILESVNRRIQEWAIRLQEDEGKLEVNIIDLISCDQLTNFQSQIRSLLFQECISIIDRSPYLHELATTLDQLRNEDLT